MKRFMQKLGMLGVGLLLGLVCAEVVAKVIDLKTASARRVATQRISRMSDDPVIRYELIPNVEAQTPGQTSTVRVNNLGFRGKDISPEKPAGTFRIAVIGDSIAFGRPYGDDTIFPAILEGMLNQSMPERRFEVVNASLSGRDTWEEVAVLERRVLPLDPDLVILQICLNDHVRLPKPAKNQQVGMFGERPWYRYSSLLRLLDTRLPGFRAHHVAWMTRLGLDTRTPEEVLRDQSVTVAQLAEVEPDWDAWSRELLRFAEMTRAHGAEILFVVFPLDYEILHGDQQTLPVLTELTAAHGIPFMDILPFFRERPKEMLRDYTHPSAKGHYVTAHELSVQIQRHLRAQP